MTKSALVISPVPFRPDWEGNRKRVGQIVETLQALRYRVHFLHVKHDEGAEAEMAAALNGSFSVIVDEKKAHAMQPWLIQARLGKLLHVYRLCNLGPDAWYFDRIGATVNRLVAQEGIQVVVCEYLFYTKLFDGLRNVVKVVDAHDVFTDRYKMFLAMGRRPQWFSTSREGERRSLTRADIVLGIQDRDAAHFRALGCENVLTLPYVPEVQAVHGARENDSLLRLCFVGSNVDVNQSAIDLFVHEIMPRLLDAGIPFRFTVVGKICSYRTLARERPHTILLGQVQDLAAVLATQDAMVNPATAGSGLPIKVMESLAHGLYVIGTPAGVRGVPCLEQLRSVFTCRNVEDWVETCRMLSARKAIADPSPTAQRDYHILKAYVGRQISAFGHELSRRIDLICAT